jgi:tRNA G10  N-methylase Trm11
LIFDPFCGVGTVLAVANALGLEALGVEKSKKRCEQARVLAVRQDEL